jgi:cupin fold WbuC family metalloprotein
MIICLNKKCKIPAHLHQDNHETILLLKGKIKIEIFQKNGEKIKEKILCNKTNNYFFYSVQKKIYHKVSSISNLSIYLETTEGAYDKSKNKYLM